MTVEELGALIKGIAPVVRQYIDQQMGRVDARIQSVEGKALIPGPQGAQGTPGDRGPQGDKGEQGESGRDGASVSPDEIESLKAEIFSLKAMLQAVPDVKALVDKQVAVAVKAAMPVFDVGSIEQLVIAHIEKTVAALPKPADGVSVTVEDVAPFIAAEVEKAVSGIPQPKDPVGIAGALIDRSGHLVLTLSDGTVKALGVVVGKDVDQQHVADLIREEVAKIPRPKDGKDGFGFDDLSEAHDEFGRLSMQFVRGDDVKSFRVPGIVDRGVYKPDTQYLKGDGVSYGGSFWIAQLDTQARPGEASEASRAWRLAVKVGRDGKPGAKGTNGINGKDGLPGKDGKGAW